MCLFIYAAFALYMYIFKGICVLLTLHDIAFVAVFHVRRRSRAMTNRGHCRLFTSGCLIFFLSLYIASALPLTSLGGAWSSLDRSTRAAPSLVVPCPSGLCRGCDIRLDRTTRSSSLPLLALCGRSVLPPRVSASTVHRNRATPPLQRIAVQMRDFMSDSHSSDPALISPGIRSHSEKKIKSNNRGVEVVPSALQDLEKKQLTKRFVFRTKDPRRKPHSVRLWPPRQTWRNFKLGKKRPTSEALAVKRQDRKDLPSKNSAPGNAVAPAAPPHRWAVYFIGKRPYQ